ncbi:MAG TPA: sigma-70 family RNA polymerase sigma factor, partial [Gemmataceae bacterium]|nr:sigma-70 family RNA polymerase sigma factor [Gemmataceae bacterium]
GNEQDAEDAFQATFLVLAQKAGAIRKKSSVGSWLYGVAYRTAVKAQAQFAKRQKHEARAPSRTPEASGESLTWREVQQVLHAELSGLSERYRAVLVHCYLEGKTQDQVALFLRVSKATVKKRLERGRALLRARLVRRGLGPAAVLVACAWPAAPAPAAVTPALLASTIKAATVFGVGTASAAGVISPRVVALTEGVLKAMILTKLKVISVVVLAVSLGFGVAGWSYGVAGTPSQQTGEERAARLAERPAADELEALRLEMEALRKEVRATRARVQLLETEVRGQKGKDASLPQSVPLNQYVAPPNGKEANLPQSAPWYQHIAPSKGQGTDLPRSAPMNQHVAPPKGQGADLPRSAPLNQYVAPPKGRERPYDVFAEAEAALKKLHANPRDKEAAKALEQATQRLKARTETEEKGNHNPRNH